MLLPYLEANRIEAGCDEAGRGCLAGSVYAAAVILPPDFHHSIYSFNIGIMAREQEKLSKDVLAVLDKKTNDLRLVSEMNEQTGEFNTVSTAPGDRRRALSFDSRTVLGTFFENLRNQYGRPSDLG